MVFLYTFLYYSFHKNVCNMSNDFKSSLENPLRKMFPEEWLRKTARGTGLIKRERKIDPTIIFWVLTLSLGVR